MDALVIDRVLLARCAKLIADGALLPFFEVELRNKVTAYEATWHAGSKSRTWNREQVERFRFCERILKMITANA